MANYLKPERKKLVLDLLVEGNTLRGINRISGIHLATIIRIIREVGANCADELDLRLRNLSLKYIQLDEVWTYCQKKQRRIKQGDSPEYGDQYVYVAIDADTKLVPCYLVGKRTVDNAIDIVNRLKQRIPGRFQLTTDAFHGYRYIVTRDFEKRVDYARIVKIFRKNGTPKYEGYTPSEVVEVVPTPVCGNPDMRHCSTSFVERQNLTMRTQMRRFTRLTNAFSKKLDCLRGALSIHFWHYNFMRNHETLRMTPAMAAGISRTFAKWEDVTG